MFIIFKFSENIYKHRAAIAAIAPQLPRNTTVRSLGLPPAAPASSTGAWANRRDQPLSPRWAPMARRGLISSKGDKDRFALRWMVFRVVFLFGCAFRWGFCEVDGISISRHILGLSVVDDGGWLTALVGHQLNSSSLPNHAPLEASPCGAPPSCPVRKWRNCTRFFAPTWPDWKV